MALSFLFLVCICLISGYFLFKKSHDEVAHLLGIFGSICLIVILILTPWQILLLLLICILISTSYESTSNLNSTKTEYQQQNISKFRDDYHLSYRGVYYCANCNTKSDEVTIPKVAYQLGYRGSTYFICMNSNAQKPTFSLSSVSKQLRFRGVPYSINKTTLVKN
ncbi:DUF4278 domain-containing protein [Anabaena variabilis FACHB-171]|nr:DUF4278 domain-containing protein [Trichormus variabilis FACHB-171]